MWQIPALWATVFLMGAAAGHVDSVVRQGEPVRAAWDIQKSTLTEGGRAFLARRSLSAVPYFRDDTGQLLQEEDGYLYGYWGGVLARYDVDTLEREVLYEAASEQNGRLFCMDGEYIYFLEIPDITPYGRKSILYRVKKDGTELTVLDENVPDAGMYAGTSEYREYTAIDTEKDILYLMDNETVICYRIQPEGGVERIAMADTLYGMVPEGFHAPSTRETHLAYWNMPSIPYCAENFGYFFACSEEERQLIRVEVKSGIVENMTAGLPEGIRRYDRLLLTHDSLFYSVDDKIWMRRGLESESEWEVWYESEQELSFCGYDESGMYFEAWTRGETWDQPDVGALYRITWEGECTRLFSMEGRQYFNEYPLGFPTRHFWVFGDYVYYYAVSEQGAGIYRLPLAKAEQSADAEQDAGTVQSADAGQGAGTVQSADAGQDTAAQEDAGTGQDAVAVQPQLVGIYRPNRVYEIGYTESVRTGPEGSVIVLPTQLDKLYLYERTEADKKINTFLKKLYQEYEEALTEEDEDFRRDIEEEWELLWNQWQGGYPEDYPDMEEQEQKRAIAEQSEREVIAAVSYIDDRYLVVDISEYAYRFPGAHGMYWEDYYVFDRGTGERLTLLDFVDNTEEEVEEIVSAYLELCGLSSSGAWGVARETERFFLTAEGIGIHYDVYELASYASGAKDIIIPYEEFRIKEEMLP